MPYFIQKQDDKFCVMKGTKEEPGETEKCHATREAALAHMRALYVHVEEAKAVGELHAILEGFKATVSNVVGNLIHGSGGILNPMRAGLGDDGKKQKCVCPECGKTLDKTMIPCEVRTCPVCESKMQAQGEEEPVSKNIDPLSEDCWLLEEAEKAEWTTAFINNLPDSSFLYVESGGKKDDEGKTVPRSLRHLPYKDSAGKVDLPHLRNAISRLGQAKTGRGWLSEDLRKRLLSKARNILSKQGGGKDDGKSFSAPPYSKLIFTKAKDDTWRWASISNISVMDKEGEIITEKAYRDAIAYAKEYGAGQLDLVHVDGTDIGECDFQVVLNGQLIEAGSLDRTPLAQKAREAVMEDPDYWGVSIKFRYDPSLFDGEVYKGGIQLLKRTILPRRMAASWGTAIAVTGGETMSKALDEETREALRKLKLTDDEIALLEEQQKSVEDPLVVTKEDSTEQDAPEADKGFWAKLLELLSRKQEPEPTAEPAVVEQPETPQAEKEVEPEQVETPASEEAPGENLKQVAEIFAKAVAEQIAPLRQELDEAKRRLTETEKDIESKVLARLDELPPVVRVAASEVSVTETDQVVEPPAQEKPERETALKQLVRDIKLEAARQSNMAQRGKVEI